MLVLVLCCVSSVVHQVVYLREGCVAVFWCLCCADVYGTKQEEKKRIQLRC